ncbi:type II toxin-antitoxin system HipA family toxin [Testudinibacter sp. P80/BLE/0925]|uniref:type II toxin-antitoxin system HipA family toxin n=1 Tax=Testudinibacter sp. TW-1 TaxID=3417757 RepID=UPI003D3655B9
MNRLTIAMNGIEVGLWTKSRDGASQFQYESTWLNHAKARPISLSLPLSEKVYKGSPVYNFFDNLLPDNEQIRSRIQQRFQVATKHPFDLLGAIGHDCVGAIQLYPQGKRPYSVRKIDAVPLSETDIAALLKNYQFSPLGMDNAHQDFRISLAGAQEKTALLYHHNQWCKPLNTTPTSHIMKLPIGIVGQGQLDLSDSCENEWLCLQLLTAFGLPVANAEILYFDDCKVLSVERFDRRWAASGRWLVRLPQEDMCQALAIAPALKYEADGGPSILSILELLKGSADSLEDRLRFFKAQIIFWLMAAIDGHAKNYSLFLEKDNRYRLTPFYDVISAFPLLKPQGLQRQKIKMAMAWHGKNKHYLWDKIQIRHFLETGRLAGLRPLLVEEILHEVATNYQSAVEQCQQRLPKNFPLEIGEPILEGVWQQGKRLKG